MEYQNIYKVSTLVSAAIQNKMHVVSHYIVITRTLVVFVTYSNEGTPLPYPFLTLSPQHRCLQMLCRQFRPCDQAFDNRCDETPHQIHRTHRSPNNAVTWHDSV